MRDGAQWRDYRLTGAEAGPGFAPADWYSTPIPRRRKKELMRRSDRPAVVNYAIWLGLLASTGAWLVLSWGSWWAVPDAVLYGVFYGSRADSRWHECAHGTAAKTRWLNEAFYHLALFMALKNPYLWRWTHIRHHTDTLVVGRDPEIAFPRPPSILGIAATCSISRPAGPRWREWCASPPACSPRTRRPFSSKSTEARRSGRPGCISRCCSQPPGCRSDSGAGCGSC